MKTIEQCAKHDDFELSDDYDFKDGVRGRFYTGNKTTTTIQLDNDIVLFLKKQANEKHTDYQTLLNSLLRDYMSGNLSVSH